jgi:flagellar biosynthesis/type III secretory pathway chaperone
VGGSVDALLAELRGILTREIELHKHLLSLLHKEKACLIDLSTEEIVENTKRKETCTLKIKMLEESRLSLIKRLSPHFSISLHELTLSKLISQLDEPHRSELEEVRSTLRSLINSIQEINQHNSMVVKDALHYCQRSLDFLYSATVANPTYVDSGKIKDPTRFGRLLSKEI